MDVNTRPPRSPVTNEPRRDRETLAPGRQRAKARGVVMGRRPKLTGHQRREAIARREAGELLTDIARSYNVSHSTISRLR
jgi:DNA invertase Pin-like site-specific DNA recombinase